MPIFDRSKIVRDLAGGKILAPFLDRAIKTFDEPWEYRYEPKVGDNGWHPSSHCTPKASELYKYATAPKPEVFESSRNKAYQNGHFWHQFLQVIVRDKLGWCEADAIERTGLSQWPVDLRGDRFGSKTAEPDAYHYCTGSGDVAPLVTPNWQGIVDFKTMNNIHFAESGLPKGFAAKYLCQINIYMDLFDEEQGLILAVQKDRPHGFKEMSFVRDDELIEAIYHKWKFVSESITEQREPTEKDDEEYALPL